MDECVFCSEAVRKQGTIYEDDMCFVILDKYPISEGHMLVIPRKHYKDMISAPEDTVCHIFKIAKQMGERVIKRLDASGVNVTTNIGTAAGQLIMHFHVHVVPRYKDRKSPDDGFVFNHNVPLADSLRGKLINVLK